MPGASSKACVSGVAGRQGRDRAKVVAEVFGTRRAVTRGTNARTSSTCAASSSSWTSDTSSTRRAIAQPLQDVIRAQPIAAIGSVRQSVGEKQDAHAYASASASAVRARNTRAGTPPAIDPVRDRFGHHGASADHGIVADVRHDHGGTADPCAGADADGCLAGG